jgi:hypothetical protein
VLGRLGRRIKPEPERVVWSVLWAANWTQAKSSTIDIVVPRDPEMVDELCRDTEPRIMDSTNFAYTRFSGE